VADGRTEAQGLAAPEVRSLLVFGGLAYGLAVRILGRAEGAEDAVQDAYLNAIGRVPPGLPPEELRVWFLRVVANAAKNHLKQEARRRRREAAVSREAPADAPARPDAELLGALRGALEALEDKYRVAVALCCEQGLSQREAAAVLEMPERTISKYVGAGLEELRKALRASGYSVAPAAVIGGLKATAPGAPAGMLAGIEKLLAGGAAVKAAVGAGTASAAGALSLGWKLAAGLALAALAGAGALGAWKWTRPPAPALPAAASAAPAKEPPAEKPQAVREMLAKKTTVRRQRMALHEICELLNRQHDLVFSLPPGDFAAPPFGKAAPARLTTGEQTVGQVLEAAKASLGLDLEVVEHRGRAIALFWDRPEPMDVAELSKLAASPEELDRCVAARWLPVAGSREALELAIKLLADGSRRVRLYAAHGLWAHWGRGFYGWRANPLAVLAAPETARAVAAELDRVADEVCAETAGRYRYTWMQLASALGNAAALPTLEKIARHEAVEKQELWKAAPSASRSAPSPPSAARRPSGSCSISSRRPVDTAGTTPPPTASAGWTRPGGASSSSAACAARSRGSSPAPSSAC